jgi:hypothetical protein
LRRYIEGILSDLSVAEFVHIASVVTARVDEVYQQPQQVLDAAYKMHPERFVRGRPTPPELPEEIWINPPEREHKVIGFADPAAKATEPGAQAGSRAKSEASLDADEHQAIVEQLLDQPGGQVVALGDGLETQFHCVDDGRVRWLAVDLPEAIALRSLFLPDSDRHRSLACSALSLRWMEAVDPRQGVFVTAVGQLKYFYPHEVRRLIAAIAERYPTVEMVFDLLTILKSCAIMLLK